MAKLYTNPLTGEAKTAREWAEYLFIEPTTFYWRRSVYGDSEKTYIRFGLGEIQNPKPKDYKTSKYKPQPRILKIYTDPVSGESGTAEQWAAKLNIALDTFYGRAYRHGDNSPVVYQKLQKK